jgi:hypothetical protein
MIKAGHAYYADHSTLVSTPDVHTVVGFDVCAWSDVERVQILRVGWEVGWFVVYQDLQADIAYYSKTIQKGEKSWSASERTSAQRHAKRVQNIARFHMSAYRGGGAIFIPPSRGPFMR